MLDGYLPMAYCGASGRIVTGEDRFSGCRFRDRLLDSPRMNGPSMCKPFALPQCFPSVRINGKYSVITQDIALLQLHTGR